MARPRRSRYKKGSNHNNHFKIQDPYFKLAKSAGYRARSAYKLKEILRKYPMIHAGDSILDLGAAPGSFLQVIAEIVGEKGRIVGVDLKEIKPIEGVETHVGDIFDFELPGGGKFDAVTSDLMPNTTGIKFLDHASSVDLNLAALQVMKKHLKRGGSAIFKVFQTNELKTLTNECRKFFKEVHAIKPDAVRKTSKEVYIVAIGFTP